MGVVFAFLGVGVAATAPAEGDALVDVDAFVDALALVMFALVEARRARCCGTRKSQRKGETNASQEGRSLHAHLL